MGKKKYKKYNIDMVRDMFDKRGYELLEKDYKNTDTNMNYICRRHPDKVQNIKLYNFNNGKGCKICANEKLSKSKRMNIDDIAKIFENKNLKLTSNNYENSKTNLNYVCNIHSETIQSTSYTKF